ncbi:hypothetical protein SO802_022527 [Lithocarpus litseifolius]|uniref:Uncharacterized protein n=1 Tax=Lithocarpus litseifolius TaxID=425828 RepID=A0AAW2C775_9ROSI
MNNKQRSVKLFCPLVSKAVWLVVWDEQRLGLGSIARTFGLDPSTLKLNGHFISRGVDFIASSVTWNSLISFFSARGFSTGKNHQDALIVDGKLTKLGSNRVRDPLDAVNGSYYVATDKVDGDSTRPQAEDFNLVKNKRLKERDTGGKAGKALHGLSSKRKQMLEDISLLKKLKINETESDIQGRGNVLPKTFVHTQFARSYMSKNLKRMRGDETIEASPCKRMT